LALQITFNESGKDQDSNVSVIPSLVHLLQACAPPSKQGMNESIQCQIEANDASAQNKRREKSFKF
jgi:hypothetical protein